MGTRKTEISYLIKEHDMNRYVLKAFHLMGRLKKESKGFSRHVRNFGWHVAWEIFLDGMIPPGKSERYVRTVESYVDKFMEPIAERYSSFDYAAYQESLSSRAEQKIPVWVCWWQGAESMPELVRMCNKRLRDTIPPQAELHIITEDNYKDYVEIPGHISEKFEKRAINMIEMSDILRAALLSRYGGFWIDSTVFIIDGFPMDYITHEFYAQRMYDPVKWKREACKGRWSGFLISGTAGHPIFLILRDAFYAWWESHDCVVDYVILDYFLLAAYKKIPFIRQIIDEMPNNNEDVFEMYKVLDQPYSEELWERLTSRTELHKLTYKVRLIKETPEGKETLYGHLLKEVGI